MKITFSEINIGSLFIYEVRIPEAELHVSITGSNLYRPTANVATTSVSDHDLFPTLFLYPEIKAI